MPFFTLPLARPETARLVTLSFGCPMLNLPWRSRRSSLAYDSSYFLSFSFTIDSLLMPKKLIKKRAFMARSQQVRCVCYQFSCLHGMVRVFGHPMIRCAWLQEDQSSKQIGFLSLQKPKLARQSIVQLTIQIIKTTTVDSVTADLISTFLHCFLITKWSTQQ